MPGEFDAAINRALDEYELMRRKAAAFDAIRGVTEASSGPAYADPMRYIFELVDSVYLRVPSPDTKGD